jgi:tRNA dimethylallyltransferase
MRYPVQIVGMRRSKEDNSRRINARVKAMIEGGLVEEVESLLAEPAGLGEQARQALGYAQIISHLRGEVSREDAIEEIKIQTRRLAKHQRTWFRKFSTGRWLEVAPDEPAAALADRLWGVASSDS